MSRRAGPFTGHSGALHPSALPSDAAATPPNLPIANAASPLNPATDAPTYPINAPPAPNGHAPGQHRRTHAPRRRASASNGRTPTHAQPSAQATITWLRAEICERYRTEVAAGAAPIRVMARMVKEVEREAHRLGLSNEAIAAGVIDRTIGDVDLRRVSSTDDGPEYVSLADDLGIALPGEQIGDYRASGKTYRWIHEQMLDFERQLLVRGCDLRVYDLLGAGNPILREMLAEYEAEHWGIRLAPEHIYLSLGALDGLDKFWRGYAYALRKRAITAHAVAFPAPGFNVPEWQAVSFGFRLHRLYTQPENHFKVTPAMLQTALDEAPDLRAIYLTISSNPTAFAYSYDELRALFDLLQRTDRELVVVADLAYVGTGEPAADRARMAAFADSGILPRTVLVHSFSKTHTLTGDRCGWLGFSDARLAAEVGPGWANSMATLPADWQLRYMACVRLFRERPELEERVRALYTHRRRRLVEYLRGIDTQHHVFARINLDDGGTVYNWSQLRPGQTVFSLFAATGLAGVPGGAFGYSDDFVRFSIGCIPVPAV